jgi:hypothetical protein
MKLFKLSLYFICLVALASCDKNSSIKQNALEKLDRIKSSITPMSGVGDGMLPFYTFLQTPSNGSFGLVNFSSYATRPYVPRNPPGGAAVATVASATTDRGHSHYEFNGAFYDASRNIVPGGAVSFGPITISPDPLRGNMYLQNSFGAAALATPTDFTSVAGQTVNFTLNPNAPASEIR